jgi:hypothetical protein
MIKTKSEFDGMVDGVRSVDSNFTPIANAEYKCENNLGIQGVWLVGGSRDYFKEFTQGNLKGIEVYNCCGSFIVATSN